MKKLRLMNTAQVLVQTSLGWLNESRADCVEVTQDEDITVIVMMNLYRRHDDEVLDPTLIGRLTIEGKTIVTDAVMNDGLNWLIEAPGHGLNIRIVPYNNERIWIDSQFSRDEPIGENLSDLYETMRTAQRSLVVNERARASLSAKTDAHNALTKNIDALNLLISRTGRRINNGEDSDHVTTQARA